MKTAERVLLISLELFNLHGEANVSSVDIANEMEISPGNLYYHFKGKELIIEALAKMYQQRMDKVLLAPEAASLTVEEFFYYLLLIFEVSHLFRFLYRNPAEFSEKYPQAARRFKKILAAKEKVFFGSLLSFRDQKMIRADDNQLKQMNELIGLIATQAPNYHLLRNLDINKKDYIYHSLSMILFALTPYINLEQDKFEALNLSIQTPPDG